MDPDLRIAIYSTGIELGTESDFNRTFDIFLKEKRRHKQMTVERDNILNGLTCSRHEPSIRRSVCLLLSVCFCPSVSMSACIFLSAGLSVCFCLFLTVCLLRSVCLTFHLSASVSLFLSVCFFLSVVCLFIFLSVCLTICPTIDFIFRLIEFGLTDDEKIGGTLSTGLGKNPVAQQVLWNYLTEVRKLLNIKYSII